MRPLLRFSTLLALIAPPAAASAQVYSVPIRWCVVAEDPNNNGRADPGERGAPAFTNPGYVGEVDADNVLWRRHERPSDAVFIPEAQVTFRSGIYNIVEDATLRFPIIPDPDPTTAGSEYGDIVATPGTSAGAEWNTAHNACVNAWREAHGVGDIGVVVINANHQRTNTGDSQPGIAVTGGRRMLLRDNAYLLPGSPLYNAAEFPVADHVDKHFGHEMGHALASLEHTCTLQNVMSTSRRDTDGDARVDNIHLSTSILQGTLAAPNSCTSNVNQVEVIRSGARAAPGCKIAGTNTDCTVMSDVRADRVRDAPLPFGDLSLFYATRDGEIVRLVHEPMGPLGRSDFVGLDEFLDFYSFIDKDQNAATGGGAEALGVPVRFDGAEFATRVRVGMDRQGFTFVATAWQFAGGAFTEVTDRRIRGYALPVRAISETEEIRLTDKVTLEVPASVFGSGLTGFRVQAAVVHARDSTTRVLDLLDEDTERPGRAIRWESPTFPVCSVTPGTAPRLGAITVLSTGLLPNRPVHLIFGDRHVANGHAGADGSVTITTSIPAGVRDGQHLITVGTDGTALTADCIADVQGGPRPPPEDGGTDQPGSDGGERGLAFSLHVGSSHPVRSFDDRADANIHLRLDASYALSSRLRAVAFLGFSQFTHDGADTPEWWANASLNLQARFPAASGMRYFLQAGPGAYLPKAGGGAVPGANVGLGGQIPLASGPFALEFGADYHRVFGDHDLDFVTAQLGVIWR